MLLHMPPVSRAKQSCPLITAWIHPQSHKQCQNVNRCTVYSVISSSPTMYLKFHSSILPLIGLTNQFVYQPIIKDDVMQGRSFIFRQTPQRILPPCVWHSDVRYLKSLGSHTSEPSLAAQPTSCNLLSLL